MQSKNTILAARAVGSVLISRTAGKFLWIVIIVAVGLFLGTIFLMTSYSGWWGLLLPLWIFILIAAAAGLLLVKFISRKLRPRALDKNEVVLINGFVDDMNEKIIAGQLVKRSPVWLAILTGFSYLRGGRNAAAKTVMSPIEEAKDLKSRFAQIINLFN